MRLTLVFVFVLILASCTSLEAYVPGISTPTPTASSTVMPEPTFSPAPVATIAATRVPGWQVCTGMAAGLLYVRGCAGMGCRVLTTLHEAQSVTLSGIRESQPSGDWALITAPRQGWVNASYLCKVGE